MFHIHGVFLWDDMKVGCGLDDDGAHTQLVNTSNHPLLSFIYSNSNCSQEESVIKCMLNNGVDLF